MTSSSTYLNNNNTQASVRLLSILLTHMLLLFQLAAADVSENADAVIELTDANFNETIQNKPIALVKFYAPWCGHCKSLAPIYSKAAELLQKDEKASSIPLYKLDATVHTKTAAKYHIDGYPTLYVFRAGVFEEYHGGRDSAETIVNYMRLANKPASEELPTLEHYRTRIAAATRSGVAVVVGLFMSQSDLTTFTRVARVLNAPDSVDSSGVAIFHTFNPTVIESAGYYSDTSGILVYPMGSTSKKVIRGGVSYTALLQFVLKTAIPRVSVETAQNYKLYAAWAKEFPKAVHCRIYYAATQDGVAAALTAKTHIQNETSEWFRTSSSSSSELIIVSLIADDAVPSGVKAASEYGYSKEDVARGVAAFLSTQAGSVVYTLPVDMPLRSLYLKYKSGEGELKAYVKSQKAADVLDSDTVESGTVLDVVGTTFEKIVQDPLKNVLIEFYAPWCGHCKALEPKYKKAAQLLADYDDVVLAKIDATANDVPNEYRAQFSVSGFPTMYFSIASAGSASKKVLKYDGKREAEDIMQWVLEHKK